MPQYSVVDCTMTDIMNEQCTFFSIFKFPTLAILLFINNYEYNYSVPGGNRQRKNRQCLIRAQFAKFSSHQPFRLYGIQVVSTNCPIDSTGLPWVTTLCIEVYTRMYAYRQMMSYIKGTATPVYLILAFLARQYIVSAQLVILINFHHLTPGNWVKLHIFSW